MSNLNNMQPINTTLAERGKTHGKFKDNAFIAQHLKTVFTSQLRWSQLSDQEREALDMIASKLARILSRKDWSNPDDWHDIAGYATLAERSLKPNVEQDEQKEPKESI